MKFLTETCSMLVRQDGIHDAVWEFVFFLAGFGCLHADLGLRT